MILFIIILILDILFLIYGIKKKNKLSIIISSIILVILLYIFTKAIFFGKVQLPYEIYNGVD